MKQVLLLALTVTMNTILFAQKPVWGIKAGLNFATFKAADKAAQDLLDSRLGYHIAVISHNHLTNKIAIQPELQFSSQGTEVNVATEDFDYRLSYINLPVMFQYMFDNGFRVEAGPYFGLLVDAKEVYDNGESQDSKDDYKKGDVGLGVGLNYLTYSGLGFGGRYNIGLANVSDLGKKVQNRVFQLSAFYMFDHNHKRKSR